MLQTPEDGFLNPIDRNPIDWDRFGRVIRILRLRANLNQVDLAEQCNVDHSYISQIENGKRFNVSIEVIQNLALALGIDPMWLIHVSSTTNHEDGDVEQYLRRLRDLIEKKLNLELD
jgi:transcriptional regulator with XRE-family HTH domain